MLHLGHHDDQHTSGYTASGDHPSSVGVGKRLYAAGIRTKLRWVSIIEIENLVTDRGDESYADLSQYTLLLDELRAIADGPAGRGAKVLLQADAINERLLTFSALGGRQKYKREHLHRLLLSWSLIDCGQSADVVQKARAELLYAIRQIQEDLLLAR